MTKRAYLAAIVAMVIFGFSFLLSKEALEAVQPEELLALRFLTAAFILGLLRLSGAIRINFRGRSLGGPILLALVQPVLYFLLETVGIQLTTSLEAGIIIGLIPVAVLILSALFLREVPTPVQTAFILLSVAGVLVIVAGQSSAAQATVAVSNRSLGLLALIGAVFAAAVYNVHSRYLSRRFRPVELTYVMMWMGAFCFSLRAFARGFGEDPPWALFSYFLEVRVALAVLYLGGLSSVGAFFLVNYALARLQASRIAVFGNLATVVSVVAGVAFRGEAFFWYHALGGSLILLGVWGTNCFATSVPGKTPGSFQSASGRRVSAD